jgi:hypothetical protein
MTIDIRPFCSTGRDRLGLTEPFSWGDWTYAVTGPIGIRVPRRPDVSENSNAPNKIIAESFTRYLAEPIADPRPVPVIVLPDGARVECPHCHGRKTKHECPDCRCHCPACAGEGYTLELLSVGVGGTIFDARYILMLAALPGARIPSRPAPESPMPCVFDGGGALLMPLTTCT